MNSYKKFNFQNFWPNNNIYINSLNKKKTFENGKCLWYIIQIVSKYSKNITMYRKCKYIRLLKISSIYGFSFLSYTQKKNRFCRILVLLKNSHFSLIFFPRSFLNLKKYSKVLVTFYFWSTKLPTRLNFLPKPITKIKRRTIFTVQKGYRQKKN